MSDGEYCEHCGTHKDTMGQLDDEKAITARLQEQIERLQSELSQSEHHIREQLARQLEQRVAHAIDTAGHGDPEEVTFSAHAIIEALRNPERRTLN
jgi:hypothetical protein